VFLDAGRGVLLTDLTPAAPGGGDSCDGSRQLDAFRLPPKVVAATGLAGGAPGHSPAARPMPPPAVTMTGCPAPADPADFERWLEVRGLPAISADGETVASLVPGPQGIALTWIEQATAGDAQRAREPIYGAGEKLPCEALRARVERVRARLAGGRWRALRELPVVAPHETPLGALDLRVTDEAKLELAGAGRLTALATQAIATIDRLWYDAASGGCAVYEGDQLHALRLPAEAAAVTGLR
jgi:hypothetical protein